MSLIKDYILLQKSFTEDYKIKGNLLVIKNLIKETSLSKELSNFID